jgi:16S rRNA C967 or C1407 C5-methylase (RsmB/RsmF family)
VAEALAGGKGFHLLAWGDQLKLLEREGVLHAGTAERLSAGDFLRTFPGLYQGDGFFAACLIRE